MTCIVGIEHNGKVFIGGDSQGTAGSFITIRTDKKVFTNGPFLMGFTTSFRMGQILQYGFKPPEQQKNTSDMAFLVTDFMDAIRKKFSESGFGTTSSGGCFLLGYKKKLYKIEPDFQVGMSSDGFRACGGGDETALGSLYATKDIIKDPKTRLIMALKAASHFNTGVGAPFTILSM